MGWKDTIKTASPTSWRDTIKPSESSPSIKMKNPDGQLEDVNSDHIGEYIKKGYQYDDTEARHKIMSDRAKETSISDSAMAGGAQGLSMGLSDEAEGFMGSAKDLFNGKTNVIENYRSNRDNARYMNEVAQLANPKSFLAGNLVGAIGTGVGMGGLVKGGADTVRNAMALGAIDAAGQSEADLTKGKVGDFANDVGKGAAIGGAFQAGSEVLAETLSPAMKYIKNKLASKAEEKAVKALDPILSQQELLRNKDAVHDLGRSLLDEDVVRFGRSVKGMQPRLEESLAKKGARIGEIRDAADQAGYGVDLRGLSENAQDGINASRHGISDKISEAAHYADNVDNLVQDPIRKINEVQDVIGDLNNTLNFNKAVNKMTPADRANNTLRQDLVEQVDNTIQSHSPANFDEYKGLKNQYSLFKDGEDILDKSTARLDRNRSFSLTDHLVGGMAKGDGMVQDSAFKIAAAMANKLVRERGNSMLATSLDMLSRQPERFGKFAQPLLDAASRGEAAVVATHALLMKDPEYRKLTEGKE